MVHRHSPLAMSLFLLALVVVPCLLALALDYHLKVIGYLSPLILVAAAVYAMRSGGDRSDGSSPAA